MSCALWFYITILHVKPSSRLSLPILAFCWEVLSLEKNTRLGGKKPTFNTNTPSTIVEGDVQVVITNIGIDRVILTIAINCPSVRAQCEAYG